MIIRNTVLEEYMIKKASVLEGMSRGDTICAFKRGEQWAFRFLYDRFSGIVKSAGRLVGLCSADIDDLTVTVWTKIWLKRSHYVDTSFEGWVWRVSCDEARDLKRRNRRYERRHRLAADNGMSDGDGAASSTADRATRDRLALARMALDRLPRRQKTIMWLHLYGYTYREIAATLAIETGTVGASLSAARRNVRDYLRAHDRDE